MAQLLRIDSSSRRQGAHSRALADQIEAAWRAAHPGGNVVRRDLARDPVPAITDETIAGFYTPDDQHTSASRAATALSDRLIAELQAADAILLSAPMYNFSIPAALKAWIDQIVRIGRTFGFDPQKGLFGMLSGKPVFVAAVYGAAGYGKDGPYAAMNFHEPYLRGLLGFLGLTDTTFFTIEGSSVDPATMEKTHAQAEAEIARKFGMAVPART